MKMLRTYPFALCFLLTVLLAVPLAAQEGQPSPEEAAMMEAMMKAATPGAPHAYLAELAGTYKATMKMFDPSGQESEAVGTMERKMVLGGRVLADSLKMEFMGMPFEGTGFTGYDNVTGKYWAIWFDNMSTGLTSLEGTMDQESGKGTLEGTSPDPMSGGMIPMKIESQRGEGGKETSTFYMGMGGQMVKTMEVTYERQ